MPSIAAFLPIFTLTTNNMKQFLKALAAVLGVFIGTATIALAASYAVGVGGTGNTSLTAHSVLVGNGSSPITTAAPGTSGYVLTSNGASSDPTFKVLPVPSLSATYPIQYSSGVISTAFSTTTANTYSGLQTIPSNKLTLTGLSDGCAQIASGQFTSTGSSCGSGSGGITSVDMTVPTGLTVSGNPITTSGTLAVALQTGYNIPKTASTTDWNTAYLNRITSATSPLSISSNAISIANAAADGSTKGAASFTANDFDASSGNISLDYTNGQKATGSVPGFLSSADWSTFNGKQSALTFSTGLTNTAGTITVNPSQNITTLSNLTGNGFVKTSGGTGALSIDTNTYLTSAVQSLVLPQGSFTGNLTIATSTNTTNGITSSIRAVGSGSTITLSSDQSGTLTVAGGGTGAATFTAGNLLYGAGTGALQSVATSTRTYSAEFSNTGTLGTQVGGTNSVVSLATNGIALSKLAQVGANIILGNNTGATGNVVAFATSTLGIALSDTTGTLAVNRGGSGAATLTGLLVGNGTSAFTGIAGNTCTNQFLRGFTSSGGTCATVANADLANSTISGVALGGSLGALTATNGSLTFSGSYDGSTARTVGLNLANPNIFTALQQFNGNASTTMLSAGSAYFGTTATTTISSIGSITMPASSILTLGTTTAGTLKTTSSGVVYADTASSGGGLQGGFAESTTTGASAWLVPTGVTKVRITAIGAGGGSDFGGGGAGGVCRKYYTSTPGAYIIFSVGVGGTAGTSGAAGHVGNNTTVGTAGAICTANGGSGGIGNTSGVVSGGSASNGDINLTGGDGKTWSQGTTIRGGDGGDTPLGYGTGGGGVPASSGAHAGVGYGSGAGGMNGGNTGGASGGDGHVFFEY